MAHSGVCLVITRKGQERNKDGVRKCKLSEKSNIAKVENALNRVALDDSGSFAFVVSHLCDRKKSQRWGTGMSSGSKRLNAPS